MRLFMVLVCVAAVVSCQSWGRFWETSTAAEAPISIITAWGSRSTGELWTNTLIGTTAGNVARVEISIANSSFAAATGTTSWKYSIPFLANLKVGRKYTFVIRAIGASGAVAATKTIDLIKRQNQDINGDGYADFAVAAKARSTSTGSVYIYYGSAAPTLPTSATLAPTIITGGGIQRSFGTSIALGDINGDGFADMAVGGEQYNAGAFNGAMWIYFGSANGFASQAASTVAQYVGIAGNDYYGGALAMGDLNGDGYQDVVVAARERPGPTGELYAYLASGSGLSLSAATTKTGIGSERLGSSVACADINNDGLADVIVGARTSTNGTVYVFHGTGSGFNTTAAATIQGEASGDGLGEGVFTGDYNNDGYTDVVVQARDRNAGFVAQGVVYLIPGSAAGITGSFSVNSATHVNYSGEVANTNFGTRAVIADANGDGLMDLFLTAYLPAATPGAVYFIPGTSTGFTSQNAAAIARKISGITTGDRFGIALNIKDINNDGYPELISGAYLRDGGGGAGQGVLSIFLGQASGFTSQSSAAANYTISGESGGDNFSWPVH